MDNSEEWRKLYIEKSHECIKALVSLQLTKSAIQTVIYELKEEQNEEKDWLIKYLYGVLDDIK